MNIEEMIKTYRFHLDASRFSAGSQAPDGLLKLCAINSALISYFKNNEDSCQKDYIEAIDDVIDFMTAIIERETPCPKQG